MKGKTISAGKSLRLKKIAKNEEKYRTLVELAPDIIYSLDKDNLIESLNDAYEKITQIRKEDVIKKSIFDIVHETDKKKAIKGINSNRKRKTPKPFLVRLKTASEDNVVIGEFRESSEDLTGNSIKRLGIIRDLTHRYNLEKQKELWVGIATHDLKTPLAGIKAFTQILASKEDDKSTPAYGYLSNINTLVDQMHTLINDMLDMTKIRTGGLILTKSPTKLNELIATSISALTNASNHIIEFVHNGDFVLNVDKARLSQVINNLISNAIKYSPGKDKVIVKIESQGPNIIISVQDFGIGIAQHNLDKIFDMFYRINPTKTSKGKSLGLGLFISRTIVNMHGGAIWAKSKLKKGSTFYVSLPKELKTQIRQK